MKALTIFIIASTITCLGGGIIWSMKGNLNTLVKVYLLLLGILGVVIMFKQNIISLVF